MTKLIKQRIILIQINSTCLWVRTLEACDHSFDVVGPFRCAHVQRLDGRNFKFGFIRVLDFIEIITCSNYATCVTIVGSSQHYCHHGQCLYKMNKNIRLINVYTINRENLFIWSFINMYVVNTSISIKQKFTNRYTNWNKSGR